MIQPSHSYSYLTTDSYLRLHDVRALLTFEMRVYTHSSYLPSGHLSLLLLLLVVICSVLTGRIAAYQNDWDGVLHVTCNRYQGEVQSTHNNYMEDCRWMWRCKQTVQGAMSSCQRSGYINYHPSFSSLHAESRASFVRMQIRLDASVHFVDFCMHMYYAYEFEYEDAQGMLIHESCRQHYIFIFHHTQHKDKIASFYGSSPGFLSHSLGTRVKDVILRINLKCNTRTLFRLIALLLRPPQDKTNYFI